MTTYTDETFLLTNDMVSEVVIFLCSKNASFFCNNQKQVYMNETFEHCTIFCNYLNSYSNK